MKTIEIVLRTCDRINVHTEWRARYCGMPKPQLVLGCSRSLIASIQSTKNVDCRLTVLDDHSSEQTQQELISMLSASGISHEFIPLEETGYNNSAYQQWVRCRDTTCDLFYSVEDDYLHSSSAIQEMVDSFYLFSDRLKREDIVIYPFDEPSEYNPPSRTDFIVYGSHRHWRTGIFSTNVIMSQPKLLKDYWKLFETLALKYNGDYLNPKTEHYEASNTIWPIWNQGNAIRFNPVPSLALHMQFDQQRDPFIDWQEWWKKYAK